MLKLQTSAALTFDKRQICEEVLKELRVNVIENLLSTIFY